MASLSACYVGVPQDQWNGVYGEGETYDSLGDEGDQGESGDGQDEAGDNGGDTTGGGGDTTGGGGDTTTGGGDTTTGGGDTTTGGGDTTTGGGDTTTTGGEEPSGLVGDMALTRVEVTQGVAVTIGNGSNPIPANNRNARLVGGRDALFRAEWSLLNGFTSRDIRGVLVLEDGGQTQVYEDVRNISGNPNINSYNGTFRWEVPGEDIAPGTTYYVGLYEVNGAGSNNTAARLPATGSADLGVPSEVHELEVRLVPIRWIYGGEDRTANITNNVIETIRAEIYAKNPVSAVNITVRQNPVVWQNSISLEGILQAISTARSQDNPADNVYYEGLADFGCFAVWNGNCSNNGGTTGLGFVTPAESWAANQRASISVLYDLDSSAETLTHELGHNQGREHAPCGGVASSDPGFPYGGGGIGVQGHRLGTTTFYSTSQGKDYMGYCEPAWVSDYTWEATADRIEWLTPGTWSSAPGDDEWLLQGLIGENGEEYWTVVRGSLDPDAADEDSSVVFRAGEVTWDERPVVVRTIPDSEVVVIVTELPEGYETPEVYGLDSAEDFLAATQVELVHYGYTETEVTELHLAGHLTDVR
ncbi:hypothetical protein PPSIR1_31698 [Plesiocystis pacifica SIR-1]|uniref:Uncharacterized protein n=1 Tax=Plesiocystis pacifica SIR-1 TaxID=391625 RepID=A6G2Q7_9BACT|nr:hypothetical protein [Plesiocystis pacifica]EDM79757.1 hypothetical protein PPSIR1_31698 [Plesiocystis pacifica SIR-1]